SPHRGARDAHAALLSLRAGPRSSTLQTAKTAAPAARAAAAVQCERAGGARRRLERAGAQKPKACWAVRGGDEAGGEGERNRSGEEEEKEEEEEAKRPQGPSRRASRWRGGAGGKAAVPGPIGHSAKTLGASWPQEEYGGGWSRGGEGGTRRRDSGVESLRPSAASSAVPGENQGGGASSASWQRSQPARAPERTGGEGGARGGRKEAKPRRGTGGRRLLLAGSPTKQKGSGCQRPGIPPLL
ncbi:unnamed protein product, partial [Prorocentrum cordatum]